MAAHSLMIVAAGFAAGTAPRMSLLARRAGVCTMAPPSPPSSGSGFGSFVGSLRQAAEDTAKAANEAADQWKNKGWQVEKRAGQILPEIRPSTDSAEETPSNWLESSAADETAIFVPPLVVGLAGASGSLSLVDGSTSAPLVAEGAIDLQNDF